MVVMLPDRCFQVLMKTEEITSTDKLLKVWPRLLKLVRLELPEIDPGVLLGHYLHCMSNGAVFVVHGYSGIVGTAHVEKMGNVGVIHGLPKNESHGYACFCLMSIKEWAKVHDVDELQITSSKMNGSNFRYFEKSLNFHRKSVTFSMRVA